MFVFKKHIQSTLSFIVILSIMILSPAIAVAQTAEQVKPKPPRKPLTKNQRIKYRANKNTISLVTGGLADTQINFAQDFSDILDRKDVPGRQGIRILPILGKGGVQNALDLLHLKGVDLAIMQSDTLAYLRGQDPLLYKHIFDRVKYITSLYYAEWHVIARKNIKSLEDLRGKKVNISYPISGTYVTSRKIFELLFIRVKYTTLSDRVALQQLKDGKIDAITVLGGSPISLLKSIKPEDGLHIVPADFYGKSSREVPFINLLRTAYVPSTLRHEHYPNLIPKGQSVTTVANAILLAAYNWAKKSKRYRKVVRFTQSFIENFDKFKIPGRHRKWREVNLATKPHEWKRFDFVEQLVANRAQAKKVVKPGISQDEQKLFVDFQNFLNRKKKGGSKLTDAQQEQLFNEFRDFMQKSQ